MKTKQETIAYCQAQINDAKRIKGTERISGKVTALEAIIETYEDVLRFLKDD